MTKVIKRKHWNEFRDPPMPRPPAKPKEYYITSKYLGCQGEDEDTFLFDKIEIPEEYSFKDLEIKNLYDSDRGENKIAVYLNEKKINENYKSEFLSYNENLVKYEQDLKDWQIEIIEYKDWKNQLSDDRLKKQIQDAKDFLKKHKSDQ